MSDAKSEKGTLIALERPTAGQSLAAVHGEDLVDHVGGHHVALPGRHIELGQVGGHRVNMDRLAPPKRKSA